MTPTRDLAEFIVAARLGDLPSAAVHAASRCLLDFIGNALGGCDHPAIDMLLRVLGVEGATEATIVGRGVRVSALNAALINGYLAHVLDFDDTLTDTVLHPTAPVLPAVLALAERDRLSGADIALAFVVGFEVEARLAEAISPSHYDQGWHITGTVGQVGAAVAAGKLLGLSVDQMVSALGLAATQPTGLRQHFGTMGKAFHPGKAAQNGLLAALLAREGMEGAAEPLAGVNGFLRAMSAAARPERLTDGLGQSWAILRDSFKPYPCGVVNHPLIDGVLALRRDFGIDPATVATIEARMSDKEPVPQLARNPQPVSGLDGKFSLAHCAAVGLLDGAVGVAQFTDARVAAADVAALRARFSVTLDASLHETEAWVAVTQLDGRRVEVHILHALGTEENPMGDAALEEKFRGLVEPLLGPERTQGLLAEVWRLPELTTVDGLLAGSRLV